MLAGGFRDNIFDTETAATLRRALCDKNLDGRPSAVKIFTVAIAEGVLRYFRGIFIPKYLQGAFGTRYLTLIPLPHFEVHYMMKISTSEEMQSNSSLLP